MTRPSEKARRLVDAFEIFAMDYADHEPQRVRSHYESAQERFMDSRRALLAYVSQLEAVAEAARVPAADLANEYSGRLAYPDLVDALAALDADGGAT